MLFAVYYVLTVHFCFREQRGCLESESRSTSGEARAGEAATAAEPLREAGDWQETGEGRAIQVPPSPRFSWSTTLSRHPLPPPRISLRRPVTTISRMETIPEEEEASSTPTTTTEQLLEVNKINPNFTYYFSMTEEINVAFCPGGLSGLIVKCVPFRSPT